MINQEQQNGNTQLNQTRNDFNDRVNRKKCRCKKKKTRSNAKDFKQE